MNERQALGAEQWFRKGTEAMNGRQWDYAIECLSNAIRLSPNALEYRQLKYRSCRKKHKSGESSRTSVKLVDIRRKLLQAKMTKNWAGVDKWAEEGIVHQPWDPQFFAHVAVACMEMQHKDVARYAWIMALKLDRTNVTYNREFGRFLCTELDYDGAEKCFKRLLEVEPEDRHAQEMLRYIDVERLINRRGYADAASTRDVKLPAEESPDAVLNLDEGGVFDLEGEAASEPAVESQARQKANQLRLARLCAEQRRWEMCIEAYQKVLRISPNDVHVREQMENAELSMMRENVEKVQRASRKEVGSESLQMEAMELERKLIDRRIQIYTERADRHSSDMALRYDLAEDYSRIGEYRQAIPLYQQACQNLNMRESALLKLGQCWICDGKRDLASRQFEMALKTLSPVENPEAWKTAHYWLGRLDESEGRTDEAKTHYSEVLLLDYDFRDTVSRIEVLQNGDPGAVRQDA